MRTTAATTLRRGFVLPALRRGFLLPVRPPWAYGVLCAVAMAVPLIVGLVTGHPHDGSIAALGAYLTAFGDLHGKPYGQRARKLVATVVLIAAGFWLGGILAPHPVLAVVVTGLVAAAGGLWRTIGVPPALALVVGYYDAVPAVWTPPLLMAAGGVLFTMLALAAWPFNRLDPLTGALSEACTAVADLLDAVDQDEERWNDRRQRVSKAIGAAATASASFHSSDEHERTPDNFVGVLRRILHETVALRVLTRSRLDPDPGPVVKALAGAIREAAAGSVVGVPVALAATTAFAKKATRAKTTPAQTDAATPADLVRLAQVRRCLDRIAAGSRTVGLLATAGVRAPERRPTLTWPKPADPAHAARVGLTSAVAMALMIGTHEHFGRWFVFMVLLALRSTYGDTVERVVLRVVGTMAGAAVAALILAVVPAQYTIVGIVLVFGTAGFALREVSYGYWAILATPLALMLADFSVTLDWPAAAIRLALTAGGGALALLAARLLWPRGEQARAKALLVDTLDRHATLIRALADQDLAAVPDRIHQAGKAAEALSGSLERLAKEPPRRRTEPPARHKPGQAPPDLLQVSRRIRDDARLLATVGPDQDESTAAMLDTMADQLEAVARAVQEDQRPPELEISITDPVLRQLSEDVRQFASSASAASISSRGMPSR